MKKICLFFAFAVLFMNCENSDSNNQTDTVEMTVETSVSEENSEPELPKYDLKYDLNNPSEKFNLPGRLTEISGLSLSPDGDFLLAHNDEQGKIFYINKSNGEIEKEIKFHKSGDYEGIESAGEYIYVVRNTGTIYEVRNPDTDDQKTESYNTDLNGANDVEGLGFDSKNNRLLLACKAKAGDGNEFKRKRAIYGFDLNTKKLITEPVFLIERDEIKNYIQKHSDRIEKIFEALVPEQAASAFAPSGIAVHPQTRDIFILSSVGKLLLILNQKGKILHIQSLDKDIHKQPEGICFDSNGTLWVSSEGRGGNGKLYRFDSE